MRCSSGPPTTLFSEVTLTTVQHAILRGIEAVFQLEEGEMLAEPMPTRDVRNGFLLYEATEGGAGVLTRLVSQEDEPRRRRTKGASDHASSRSAMILCPSLRRTSSISRTQSCVAACYRCLMSYYNQPDHESLDRRDEDARAMLLRLARARTAGTQPIASIVTGVPGEYFANVTKSSVDRWRAEAQRRGIPAHDPKPLVAGEHSVHRVWRKHYVAALVDETDLPALQPLEDLGFEVIQFEDSADWRAAFARLASALDLRSDAQ